MGIFSAAIALLSNGSVSQQKKSPLRPSKDERQRKSTILVIDDDPMLLQTVKSLLVQRGINVLTASSAQRGLEIFHYAARDIRIVALNFNMPKLSGEEALKFIKQRNPNAKVIGLTSMKFGALPNEYVEGVDTLVSKPIVATALLRVVCELLGDERATLATMEQ